MPQPLWASYARAQSPAQCKSVSWCSDRTSCSSLCAHCFLSCCWAPLKQACSAPSLQVFTDIGEIPLDPPLDWTAPALSPSHIWDALEPLSSLLDSPCYIHVSLVMGSPELELVLSVWPHQCRVEGKDCLPQPTGNTPPKAAQDTISFLCSKDTLLAYIILYPFLLLGPRKFLLRLFLITNILEKLN